MLSFGFGVGVKGTEPWIMGFGFGIGVKGTELWIMGFGFSAVGGGA